MKKIPVTFQILLTLAIFAGVLFFYYTGSFESLEVRYQDYLFRKRPVEKDISKNIVIVSISENSIEKIGKWPWPRGKFAEVLDKLQKAQVKVVGFDALFSREGDKKSDQEFSEALRKFPETILGNLYTPTKEMDDEGEIVDSIEIHEPLSLFKNSCGKTGFINSSNDIFNIDGVLRELVLTKKSVDNTHYCFSIAILSEFFKVAELELTLRKLKLGKEEILLSNRRFVKKILSSWKFWKNYQVNYCSAFQLNYYGPYIQGYFPKVDFYDLISGKVSVDILKDKIVLIGPTAAALNDIVQTPFGLMPGVEVHATVIENILKKEFLRRMDFQDNLWIFAFFASLLILYLYNTSFSLWEFLVFPLIIGAVHYTSAQLFIRGILFDVIPLIVLAVILFVVLRLLQAYLKLFIANNNLKQANNALEDSLKNLSYLYDTAMTMQDFEEAEKAAGKALEGLADRVGCQKTIMLFSDDDFETIQNTIIWPSDEKVNYNENLILQAIAKGPEVIEIQNSPDLFPEMNDYRGMILQAKKRRFGLLAALSDKKIIFPNINEFISTTGAQIAIAIENSRLYRLAVYDGMTGLYVHRYFQRQLHMEFKRSLRYDRPLSLLMTDIDHFKGFNDTYGHQAGDAVLKGVAEVLKDTARTTDIACRYGGEEFSLICPETDLDQAFLFAERVRTRIEEGKFEFQGQIFHVKLSIGICVLNSLTSPHIEDTQLMIKFADECLYFAKEHGRNQSVICEPSGKSKAVFDNRKGDREELALKNTG